MPKNIVICCDGTGNEIEEHLSNVLKLYRIARRTRDQLVYYDAGVGTLSRRGGWQWFRNEAMGIFGLATGWGLDDNILDAYRFLMANYKDGDRIYLFGFSRGAYTVRALAGFLRLVGMLRPEQDNLTDYALTAYKQASERNDLGIAWRFQKITGARYLPIHFVGVWDTVVSVLVPRRDRFYIPSMQTLPYTRINSAVRAFRQACAIDERRRMYRLNRWAEPQWHGSNPFVPDDKKIDQDIRQVWFAGVHADIGGGYPEKESAPSKFPLRWLIEEAVDHGLLINKTMFNHLVLGQVDKDGTQIYSKPDVKTPIHNSMNWIWPLLEFIPKRVKYRNWPHGASLLGFYFPLCEPRFIPDGALVHKSVVDRMADDPKYRPPNLPGTYEVVD